ncbi:MAG: hypothetical protein ALECFALPRED_002223 [Alectoria fallacina]|uniref:Uncharacterized protein n=1 Tax=Alectoria fallacina TaxID=1903189 RepID=A0A8H3IL00_9LECA|nr:MAG: hypothetical protein ALECFALPRED_002223 [Alectoria fallacina]
MRLGLEAGWPDIPFAVTIPNPDPHEDCYLSFPVVGDRLGTAAENRYFILETLEQIAKLKAQPTGSIPQGFHVSGYDVRFGMEPVPQHPLSLDLACAALRIMYNIVVDSEVREFLALVVCQGMALGRFRTWFSETKGGALPVNATSSERRRLL